jgi:hypothetical protein
MPHIYMPTEVKDLIEGWSVVVDEDRRWHLMDRDGRERAVFAKEYYTVWFSWVGDVSLEDLRASYLDPEGAPLFVGERWRSVWK